MNETKDDRAVPMDDYMSCNEIWESTQAEAGIVYLQRRGVRMIL